MRSDRLFLEDIIDAVDRINEFLAGIGPRTSPLTKSPKPRYSTSSR